MKQLLRIGTLIVILLSVVCPQTYGQDFFNDYVPLRSQGEVPEDFSVATSEKIKHAQGERREGLTAKQQKIFVEQVNYTIDDLLKSGLVTYGDEVTNYIQRIGDRLTASESGLEGKLRFYTVNANEANAFSTDQGMVFVTTGLIAQMTNEAQLAFVLAHEIVHYQEEHVLDLYDYVMDNKSLSYGEKVRFFSKYSRDNEFEADKMGVKLYHAAGYASSEITKTFDVLIYSYLPFEEIPFRKDYFNSEQLYIPEKLFEGPRSEISVRQKYDDRYTSHPNVAKRIEALEKEILKYSDWGLVIDYPEQSFTRIRNICRFEFVLNQVYDNETIDALYSIYLLEHDFPSSRFLKLCKAQIWLELMKEEERSPYDFGTYIMNYARERQFYEGEISVLDRFLNHLPDEALVSVGMRVIRDIYASDTSDALFKRVWNKSLELAASHSDFELEHFSGYNFSDAVAKMEAERLIQENDTSGTVSKRWDKYETIRNKRSGLTIDEGIDSTKFYLYGISDLVSDSLFRKTFEEYVEKAKSKEREEEDFFAMTDEEQQEINMTEYEEKLHLGLDTILLVNPIVTEIKGYDRVDFHKSDDLEKTLLEAIQTVSTDLGVVVKQLDRTQLESMTTQQYNDIALIMRSIEKGVQTTRPDVFMMDLEWLDSLKLVYGSSRVMFLTLEHVYDDHINIVNGVAFTVLFPIGMIYFPIALLTAHTTEMNVYIMDLETGEMIVEERYYSSDPASKKMIESRCYALFNQLKEPANETN